MHSPKSYLRNAVQFFNKLDKFSLKLTRPKVGKMKISTGNDSS